MGIVIVVIVVVAWVVAFVSKRRFGVLGLSLTAGVVLANTLTEWIVNQFAQYEITMSALSVKTIVTIALTLLPVLLVLTGGPSYRSRNQTFIGATLFACMTLVFLFMPLYGIVPTDTALQPVTTFLGNHNSSLMAVFVVVAVVDVWRTRIPPMSRKTRDK